LSEHGDVLETQTITVCPPQSFLANSVPAPQHILYVFCHIERTKLSTTL